MAGIHKFVGPLKQWCWELCPPEERSFPPEVEKKRSRREEGDGKKGRNLQKREEKNAQSERSRAQTHGSESGNALIALGLSHFPLSCIRVSEAPIGASSRISEGPPELLSSVGRFSSWVCCFRRGFVSKHARESVRKRSPGITPRPGIAHTYIVDT